MGAPYGNCKADKENYGLSPTELSCEAEAELLAEAALWALEFDEKSIYEDEEMGKWETDLGTRRAPISELDGKYILWQGRLSGYEYDGTLFFIPRGNAVGSTTRIREYSSGNRDEDYIRTEISLVKTAPSPQDKAVYYAASEDNPYDTVYGVDPLAESVFIAEGARRIASSDVFKQLPRLGSIFIPSSLEEICGSGELSLQGCSGPVSITVDPGNRVFHASGNCLIMSEKRRLIAGAPCCEIPDDGSVTEILPFTFYRSKIKHVAIPDGVECIPEYAFAQSELESVVIPKSVVKIARNAFGYCGALRAVYYKGTKEEWQGARGSFGTALSGSAVYAYSDRKPTEDGNFWHYDNEGKPAKW